MDTRKIKPGTTHPDVMKLRDLNYGNRFFTTEIVNKGKVRKCCVCDEEINKGGIILNGTPYHDECFNARN